VPKVWTLSVHGNRINFIGYESKVSADVVGATHRSLPGDATVPLNQTGAQVNPGKSSGLLINMQGEVVGINSHIFSLSGIYQGVSFAIPMDVAHNRLQILMTAKVTRRRSHLQSLAIDGTAQDAAKFYADTFPDSSVAAVHKVPSDYPSGKRGDVLTVQFTVTGIPCLGLNGGQESECGWCKNKWGLSWQITLRVLTDAIANPDPAVSKRAFEAMMNMKKIDTAAIEAAVCG
jgi:predicted 3-demethylubiquinone-9 3-methyltransferase (glyoxalase superfamily)